MKIALTGATGFLGHYLAEHLAALGHRLVCWARPSSDRASLQHLGATVEWVEGDLGHPAGFPALVEGCDAVVHAALYRPSRDFRGGEGDIGQYVDWNVAGSIRLVEAARAAGCGRFVFVSTCAVHEKILTDRPLDETHPLWPMSHYGAYKAAVEAFVHSYGMGHGYPVCAVRPSGIYGVARPVEDSKWHGLVSAVARGETVSCLRGGKEVHASDVARAVGILLDAAGIEGESYNCCDRYISEYEVATIARRLSGSEARIEGAETKAKNRIETGKLRALGMVFGGEQLLEQTVAALLAGR